MKNLLDFIKSFSEGASEKELLTKFPLMSKVELTKTLNEHLMKQQITIFKKDGVIYYKALINESDDCEKLVYDLIEQSKGEGIWLREIKDKTNIPHNLVGKVLRSLENKRMIKSLKCLKTNRKIYVLYDQVPSDEITGGIWFQDNDVDIDCVKEMLKIVTLYLRKKTLVEDNNCLIKYDKNPSLEEITDYLNSLNIISSRLKISEVKTLVDVLVFDGQAEILKDKNTCRYRILN